MADVKFGRVPTPPAVRARNFKLERYLLPGPAPVAWDAGMGVTDWPMYLNGGPGAIGDCTCAAAGHQEEIWTFEVDGQVFKVSDQDVVKLYETQGYRPGHPETDRGATCEGVLKAWRKVGIGGRTILGYAEVNVGNRALLETGLWLFGGLYIGFEFPASAMDQFDVGKAWDVVPDDGGVRDGHAVNVVTYDPNGLTCVTWGTLQRMTWAFWHRYVDEAYVAIPTDYNRLANRPLANGFNEAQLIADLNSIGGNIPPQPTPAPPGPPAPSPGPLPPKPPPGVLQWLRDLVAWLERWLV